MPHKNSSVHVFVLTIDGQNSSEAGSEDPGERRKERERERERERRENRKKRKKKLEESGTSKFNIVHSCTHRDTKEIPTYPVNKLGPSSHHLTVEASHIQIYIKSYQSLAFVASRVEIEREHPA
jgi:hypothetical protein